MTTALVDLTPEISIDNEWFTATAVRQLDCRLFVHIKYKIWNKTSKKKTLEALDAVDEPLYAFVHDEHHFKYLQKLGFSTTGSLVKSEFPGKEGLVFPEVVYFRGGIDNYNVEVYQANSLFFLPIEQISGYGRIEEIEEKLSSLEQVKYTTDHYFSDGVYTRETKIPKGTMLTGYRHRNETISILVSGVISVIGVDSLGYAEDFGVLTAPKIFSTKPGIKKIGLAHEDTIFVNSFSLKDLDKKYHSIEYIDIIEEHIFDRGTLCLEYP